jgi:hypothetical protein
LFNNWALLLVHSTFRADERRGGRRTWPPWDRKISAMCRSSLTLKRWLAVCRCCFQLRPLVLKILQSQISTTTTRAHTHAHHTHTHTNCEPVAEEVVEDLDHVGSCVKKVHVNRRPAIQLLDGAMRGVRACVCVCVCVCVRACAERTLDVVVEVGTQDMVDALRVAHHHNPRLGRRSHHPHVPVLFVSLVVSCCVVSCRVTACAMCYG